MTVGGERESPTFTAPAETAPAPTLSREERGEGVRERRLPNVLRRVLMRGDDLVGGAAGDLGHVVELAGEAAGASGG